MPFPHLHPQQLVLAMAQRVKAALDHPLPATALPAPQQQQRNATSQQPSMPLHMPLHICVTSIFDLIERVVQWPICPLIGWKQDVSSVIKSVIELDQTHYSPESMVKFSHAATRVQNQQAVLISVAHGSSRWVLGAATGAVPGTAPVVLPARGE